MKSRFDIATRTLALASLTAIVAGAIFAAREPRPLKSFVRAEIPEAAALLEHSDFAREPTGGASNTEALTGDVTGKQLVTTAPSSATDAFQVHARGGSTAIGVGLVGASASALHVEDGVAVYREAYRNVDVVAIAESERFELLYVARDVAAASDLRLHVTMDDGDSLREEPSSHAMLVVGATGRPRARIARPTAIDARGEHRTGSYLIEGGDLRIAIDTRGLHAPLVVDPAITLPLWSIVRDGRVPGQAVYDATILSRESHLAFDSARGKVVLVRPVRSQQNEDTTFLSGNAANMPDSVASRAILPTPRTPSATGVAPSAALLAEWKRGWDLEGETWEWGAGVWSVVDSARLPGIVDPAIAFDAGRARTVLYGGAATSSFKCFDVGYGVKCGADESDATATYEYDGATWSVKRLAGAPPPRLRASMAWSPALGKLVLFGGRAFGTIGRITDQALVDPHGPLFPENLAGDLLGDTWVYDGVSWDRVPTGSPPPPREGAQLVLDAARGVLVLVGGHAADDLTGESDPLAIWEFDGVDWTKKLAAGDAGQPASIATRRGAAAFYNPLRKRVTVMGGTVKKLDFCTLSDAQTTQQLTATQNDPAGRLALQATGCLGGFVHDAWEWDGAALTKTSDVVFGGDVGATPVFRQVAGATPWATAGAAPDAGAGPAATTPLLPYRYDGRRDHFALRTELERAHYTPPTVDAGAPIAPTTTPTGAPASPLFASRTRPEMIFDPARGVATFFAADAVYETDGATWTDRSPPRSPFVSGANDFLATTWDSAAQRIVAFDPRDASTWALTDGGGWTQLAAANPPSAWTVDPSIRTKRDFARAQFAAFAALQPQMPKMTFDRVRGRTVMLYRGATWEYDGAAWTQAVLPPTWSQCSAATLVEYDSARSRTVAFGCKVPAETWEWDGATWTGPGPSPFTALVQRPVSVFMYGQLYQTYWQGTMELAWAHPNAAFESATLGGISTFDADGTARTWTGTTWNAGPKVASGMTCLASSYGDKAHPFVPTCASPPAFEDAAHGRLLALRDGPRGMLELPLAGVAPVDRAWRMLALGTEGFAPNNPNVVGNVQANPYPFELMSAESVQLSMQSAPASRTGNFGYGTASNPPEGVVQNLWWPYRVFVDAVSKRVRVLTNRGALWELGGEVLRGLGETCASNLDCGDGACVDGVCCDDGACGGKLCMTCKGAHVGKCEAVPAGTTDPHGSCGAGECAGMCPGTVNATACVFDPARKCGPAPTCSGETTVPRGLCSASAATCVAATAQHVPTCKVATCDAQSVTLVSAAVGAACGDNSNQCLGTLACDTGGACTRGAAPVIDSSNPCRVGHCDPATGTVTYTTLAAGATCGDNSNKCLGTATCDVQGACVRSAPVAVDTSSACRVGSCNPANGTVTYTTLAPGASCGPNVNGCAATSTCNNTGACVPGSGPAVDTSNACRVPTCNVGAGTVTYSTLSPGTACGDNSNKCVGPSACAPNGACVAGNPPPIDTSNPCRVGRCDPATGTVSYSSAPKGTACADNSNMCAAASTCDGAGACKVGSPPTVDDGEPCTTDRCDPNVGPAHDLVANCLKLPPDPSTVATPIDPTIATDIASANAYLYTGPNPIQTGVTPGAIDPTRVAIVRGNVQQRDGSPLAGARVRVSQHPELGQTLSRADGAYTLAVNGGGPIVLDVSFIGYLPSQRTVSTTFRAHVDAPAVALIPYDTQVTEIHPSVGGVARGSVTTDTDGTRQPTIVFPSGNGATMRLPDGSSRDLGKIRFRATEYTVGPNGPKSMPGSLPPESAYTYAVSLDLDEAVAAGATTVEFDKPVPLYVENFLHFPAGTIAPVGYYDRDAGAWRAVENGVVLTILNVSGGVAAIDADGDGLADADGALVARGISHDERVQLAGLYTAGTSLWRAQLRHFSAADVNWPSRPPDDSCACSRIPDEKAKTPDIDCHTPGSVIGCTTQSLGEEIPLTGTSQSLTYSSDRVSGRVDGFRVTHPLTAGALPPSLKRVDVEVHIAGRVTKQSFGPIPGLTTDFVWDGKDVEGRTLRGLHPAQIKVGFVYDGVYESPWRGASGPDYDQAFGHYSYDRASVGNGRTRDEITLWAADETYLLGVGNFDRLHAEGWSLSSHHVLDPNTHVVYRGDGSRLGASTLGRAMLKAEHRPITDGACAVAAGPDGSVFVTVRDTALGEERIVRVRADGDVRVLWTSTAWGNLVCSIAVGPDGSAYFALTIDAKVIRIAPDGHIETFAGTGTSGLAGEGQYAVNAQLRSPQLVAVGKDGNVYVVDSNSGNDTRLLKIDRNNILTAVMRSTGALNADGPLSQATMGAVIKSLAVTDDGSVFFVQWPISDPNQQIQNDRTHLRRIRPSGLVETVAVTSTRTDITAINLPTALAASPDGALYVCDFNRLLKYHLDGVFETITGDDSYVVPGAIDPPKDYARCGWGLAATPDGNVVSADMPLFQGAYPQPNIFRVVSSLPGYSLNESVVPELDGSVAYVFDGRGRHLRTIDTATKTVRARFDYDTRGYLASVTDADGDVLSVRHDGSGVLTAIDAPFGQRTFLSADANGALFAATDPAGGVINLHYKAGAILDTFIDAKAEIHRFEYDADGRLLRDVNPSGAFKQIVRSELPTGWTTALSTALGRTKTYRTETLPNGDEQMIVTDPSGLVSRVVTRKDHGIVTSYAPDGTISTDTIDRDPRFGSAVPLVSVGTVRTPSGLTAMTQSTRQVDLADPADPLSPRSITNTVTVNGVTSTSFVDVVQRATNVTSAQSYAIASTFDTMGRTTSVSVPRLAPMSVIYDAHGRASQITFGARTATINYDAAGNISRVIDPMGRISAFGYDTLGRPTRITLPDSRFALASYDANNNITSFTPPSRSAHLFAFLPGDLASTYAPPVVPATGTNTTAYSYDGDMAIQTVTMPDGSHVTIGRDSGGRVATLTTPVGVTTVMYDPNSGHVASVAAPFGPTLAYGYDGPLLTDTTWSGVVGGSVHSDYDRNFRVISESVSGGAATSYVYDAAGLLKTAGASTFVRDSLNGILLGATVGGVTDERTYSEYAEPRSYIASFGSRTLLNESYVRDPLGRITEKVETVDGVSHTYEYGYDVGGRLVEVKTDGAITGSYGYDGNGNRTTVLAGGAASTATYDAQDRLSAYGPVVFTYNENGALKTRVEGAQTTTYDYDVLGNLRSVRLPRGSVIEYVVDAANRRVGKRVDGTMVQGLLYANAVKPIAELDGNGSVVSRFVYGSNPLVPDYLVKNGTLYRILSDHLGSPRVVLNAATGAVAQRMDFDEWGTVVRDTNPGFQPFGFAAGIYDRDTGHVRHGARDYDARVGRWTAKDPSGLGGGANVYAYAESDPVNYIDSDGHFAVPVVVYLAIMVLGMATSAPSDTAGAPADILGMCLSVTGLKSLVPDAAGILQGLTSKWAWKLTRNPALATDVLSFEEQVAVAACPKLEAATFGKAVERLVAKEIKNTPRYDRLFKHLGQANQPDFLGRGWANGRTFDITTAAQIPAHVARPYGSVLEFATYARPASWLGAVE